MRNMRIHDRRSVQPDTVVLERTTEVPPGALQGDCRFGICGKEAACRRITATTHICVCPHDNSPPTGPDLSCPRVVVPAAPSRIHNIIPPGTSVNTSTLRPSKSRSRDERTTVKTLTVGGGGGGGGGVAIGVYPTKRLSTAPSVPAAVTVAVSAAPSALFGTPEAQIALGCSVVFVLLVMLLLISRCVRRRRPNHRTPTQRNPTKGPVCAALFQSNPLYVTPGLSRRAGTTNLPLPPRSPPPPTPLEFRSSTGISDGNSPVVDVIPRDALTLLEHIGEGCFGKVYKGEVVLNGTPITVAVKMLKESATRETEEDFLREVEVMSGFRHRHILALLGVVSRDAANSPCMIFEYMHFGDLTGVLRSSGRTSGPLKQKIPHLSTAELIKAAYQVSLGMTYLAGQHFVHRDLACRNCLVAEDFTVKIADFGMSRDVYTCDYYRVRTGVAGTRMLPVRWMAPEALLYGRFTLESDVWSFGVLLWEVMYRGRQPYYGRSNEEAVNLVLQGQLLVPPSDCPNTLSELMNMCWKCEPRDRIAFPEISSRLEAILASELRSQRLPRPPARPVAVPILPSTPTSLITSTPQDLSVMDPENYLLPRVPASEECLYLQPLPD